MAEEAKEEGKEQTEGSETEALQAQLDELKSQNVELEKRAQEYDSASLSPAKLAEILGDTTVADDPSPKTAAEVVKELGINLDDLSDEGRAIVTFFSEKMNKMTGDYLQREKLKEVVGELKELQQADPKRFNELKPELERIATENPGIRPKTAWALATKEADLKAAKEEAHKEAEELFQKKGKASAGGKPGVAKETSSPAPAKSVQDALDSAWEKLGDKADVLS